MYTLWLVNNRGFAVILGYLENLDLQLAGIFPSQVPRFAFGSGLGNLTRSYLGFKQLSPLPLQFPLLSSLLGLCPLQLLAHLTTHRSPPNKSVEERKCDLLQLGVLPGQHLLGPAHLLLQSGHL